MYQRSSVPQSIGGVLDDGFKLYSASLPKVAALSLVAGLMGQLLNRAMPTTPGAAFDWGTVVVAWVVSMFASGWLYAAIIVRMDGVVRQQEVSLGEALAQAGRRLLPFVLLSVLLSIVIMVGFLLLLVPGIILSVTLMFSFFFLVLEGEGPIQSLQSSHNLVWGSWWRTLAILSVAFVIIIVAYTLVGFIVGFFVAMGGGEPENTVVAVQFVLIPLLSAVILPLMYALIMAAYYDLKLRRSGSDLEERLGAATQT